MNGIEHGIDHLENIVEISAIDLGVNRQKYGTLHDDGHLIIGVIHDPDNKHLEPPAAMGYHSSALRDPCSTPGSPASLYRYGVTVSGCRNYRGISNHRR